jgi:tRNA modification GTPase
MWNKTDLAAPARRWSRWRLWPAAWAASASPVRPHRRGAGCVRQRLLQVAGWQSAAEGLYIARARHVEALQAVEPTCRRPMTS